MKRKSLIITASFISLILCSCGGSKQIPNNYYNNPQTTNNNDNPYGDEVKKTPAEEYALAAPGKRAAGSGRSWSENVAQQAAEADARRAFSESIDAAIKSAFDRAGIDYDLYSGNNESGNQVTDGGSKQRAMVDIVSQNIIRNTHVVKKNKYYNSKNKIYTIFICLEYMGEVSDIAKNTTEQIIQQVSDKDRSKIQKEIDAFKKEIELKLQTNKDNNN